jgi:hypothetical protein
MLILDEAQMNKLTFCLIAFLCFLFGTVDTLRSSPESAKQSSTLAAHKAAFAQPFDRDKIAAYMASLPKDGDYFVVEGDVLLTEQELRSYLVANAQTEKPATVSPELLVNTHNGEPDFYRDPSHRNLSYSVDRSTFTADEYKMVVQNVDQAGKAWENACTECQVHFTHLSQFDQNPQSGQVNFIVRKHDSKGEYIAASFFPHDDQVRRILNVDPTYFNTTFDKVGVFRHEMGHILGYRHEHIRGIQGCYYEDKAWQPLTPYDPKSVMHYFCGGGGSLQLQLTTLDQTGHRSLYGDGAVSLGGEVGNSPTPAIVVNFEGGYISQNIIKVVAILQERKLIEIRTYQPKVGDTLESIFFTNPQSPYDRKVAMDLARYLNGREVPLDGITPSKEIFALSIKLDPYDFSTSFDRQSEKDLAILGEIKESWSNRVKYEVLKGSVESLKLRGYQLRVPVPTEHEAREVQQTLLLAVSTYTTTVNVVGLTHQAEYFSGLLTSVNDEGIFPQLPQPQDTRENAREFWKDVRLRPKDLIVGRQGYLGFLINMPELSDDLRSCSKPQCPDVVLIDTPIFLHPDLGQAVVEGGKEFPETINLVTPDNKQIIEEGDFDKAKDHGTHLAGIIASQDNHFGLIGINPSAHLHSWNWDEYSHDLSALGKRMAHVEDKVPMQIYVFASQWPWDTALKPEDRIANNPVTRKLKNPKELLIAAAGEDPKGGTNIKSDYAYGPMNLGDGQNIVVVTAYADNNGRPRPRLRGDSNYSTDGLVQIAGPGGDIPSTIQFSKYALAAGTSQATAFVAAIASAMVTEWPSYYTDGAHVKFRLQLTADPALAKEDFGKVRAGLLDASKALLDPTKNWIDDGNGIDPKTGKGRTDEFEWCETRIDVLDPVTDDYMEGGSALDLTSVDRIYRDPDNHWVFFAKVEEKPGEIRRIGPGNIRDSDSTLFVTAGKPFSFSRIQDVLLTAGYHDVAPTCPKAAKEARKPAAKRAKLK